MKPGFVASSLMALSLVTLPAFAKGNNPGDKKISVVRVEAEVAFDANAEQAIVDIVNQERADAGLAPLSVDPRLREAARGHSRDMGDLGFFDHTSPVKGKARFTDRIKAEGLAKFGTAGENIAVGSFRPRERAETFMDMWMNSDGHRANILGEDYRYIGVGVYVTAEGEVYATQEFISIGATTAGEASPVAPARPGLQIAPPQPSPEDVFGGTEETSDEETYAAPDDEDAAREAQKAKIRKQLAARGGELAPQEEVYQSTAPQMNQSGANADRKAKILSILEERSEYNEEYVSPSAVYTRSAPSQSYQPGGLSNEEKKAKIKRILEERDETTDSSGGVVIIVVPQQQPTYHRSYYTPQPKKNGCH